MTLEIEINTQMSNHAKAAAEMILAEYGQTLDYSEKTIGAVSAILNGLREGDDKSDEFHKTIALLFGSYIGEVIRYAFPHASWQRGIEEPEFEVAVIQLNETALHPISWCLDQLQHGKEHSVANIYMEFREALAESELNESIENSTAKPWWKLW